MADEDPRISQLYRGLPREEPPAALEATIVGAARRAVAPRARTWYVPVSLAAVLVLAVSVTLHVREERPDLELASSTAKIEPTAPTAPAAPAAAPPTAAAPAQPPLEREARLAARPGAGQRGEVAGVESRDKAKEVAPAGPSVFVPDPQADRRSAPARAAKDDRANTALREAAPAAPAASASDAVVSPKAESIAEKPASTELDTLRSERRERAAAGATAAAPAPRSAPAPAQEAARQDLAKLQAVESPERWLERIAELRRSGRDKEADDSLAEFRKRYPDYRIPPEMLQRIQAR